MARRGTIEARLAALHALRAAPFTPEAIRALRAAVGTRTGLIVAAAAEIIGEAGIDQLSGELPAAFATCLDEPIKRDPQCAAKKAIAKALLELGRWHDDVFARGIRHVQREPVWGGTEDTAPALRGMCALAYAQLGRADAVIAIAELLADPERVARAAAARALGDSGRPDAIPLLRFKVRIGDPEQDVLGAAFASLLALDPEDSLGFVLSCLGDGGSLAEAAALALGESRNPKAAPHLISWCEDAARLERRQIGYLALALLRFDPATQYLLDAIRTAAPPTAEAAVRALATFAHDPDLSGQVRDAASENRAPAVLATVTVAFPSDR